MWTIIKWIFTGLIPGLWHIFLLCFTSAPVFLTVFAIINLVMGICRVNRWTDGGDGQFMLGMILLIIMIGYGVIITG